MGGLWYKTSQVRSMRRRALPDVMKTTGSFSWFVDWGRDDPGMLICRDFHPEGAVVPEKLFFVCCLFFTQFHPATSAEAAFHASLLHSCF